jgi:hypothetical protein
MGDESDEDYSEVKKEKDAKEQDVEDIISFEKEKLISETKGDIEIEESKAHKEDSAEDTKKLLYLVGGVVLVFALIVGAALLAKVYYKQEVLTVDDLHKLNIEGKLPPEQGYMYNGFSFIYQNGLWLSQLKRDGKDYDINLHYGPKDLEQIPMRGNGILNQSEIFISFDLSTGSAEKGYLALAGAELGANLAKGLDIRPIAACVNNDSYACFNRSIVNCRNKDKNVIVIEESNFTEVKFDGGCVTIKGREKELIKAVDRFLYYWYKIMGQ